MRRMFRKLLVILLLAMTVVFATAAEESNTAEDLLYVIYDSSNSMWGELSDGSRKYEAGRRALASSLPPDSSPKEVAFRAYGHRKAGDCRDSELIVPPTSAQTAKPLVQTAVNGIRPTGKTPITYSLQQSLKDFGDRRGDILLISDGIETCDSDPCALMDDWRAEGVNIRVHVVGVGLNDVERQAMTCVAQTGGGRYFDAGSEGELQDALHEVSTLEPGEPTPVPKARGFGLNIKGQDDTGRSFVVAGRLINEAGDEVISNLTSNGQYWLEEAGEYSMTVGILLADGSIYKPVTQQVSISDPGSKRVDVLVTRPAIVSASFTENGAEHRGAHVTVYEDGQEVFGFRAHDEALMRPGDYEFRSTPNADNPLVVTATLVEGEHTVVEFNLVNTVEVRFRYLLPNGETDQRGGELVQGDEVRYTTYAKRASTVLPGTYTLRDKFKQVLNPLTPVDVVITEVEEQVIDVPMLAGYIVTQYVGEDRDFVKRKGGYTYIHALDAQGKSIGSKTASPGRTVVAKPGRYRVLGHSGKGYFDPVEITVANDETVEVEVVAKPVAQVSMVYAPGAYAREPDRASLVPLDGQKPIKTYMGIGKVLKVPPGRYRIEPHSYTPEAKAPPEFTLQAGEVREIVIPLK